MYFFANKRHDRLSSGLACHVVSRPMRRLAYVRASLRRPACEVQGAWRVVDSLISILYPKSPSSHIDLKTTQRGPDSGCARLGPVRHAVRASGVKSTWTPQCRPAVRSFPCRGSESDDRRLGLDRERWIMAANPSSLTRISSILPETGDSKLPAWRMKLS